ncbi:hypothetical protein D9Y22_15800 [Methylorubrum sp. DB1722]|nr:hypothetical protein [Methylorubrum sp. DB1722]
MGWSSPRLHTGDCCRRRLCHQRFVSPRSEAEHLVINADITIVTFLMVVLIQNSPNRDGPALHARLEEPIRAGAARDHFTGIENLTERNSASCDDAARHGSDARTGRGHCREPARIRVRIGWHPFCATDETNACNGFRPSDILHRPMR